MNGTDPSEIILGAAAAVAGSLLNATAQLLAARGAAFGPANEVAVTANGTTHVEETESTPQDMVFGIALILSGGAFIFHNLSFLKLPYTVIMFFYGLLMGAIGTTMGHDSRYADIFSGLGTVSPELVFHIFLPILIFEGSYGMKTHAFWTILSFVLLFAGPGLLINMCFIGTALKFMYPLWNWYLAGLLGAVLSATDPVAVVALLKDLGVDKRMTAMVDGEAIMNDGTAIIMFSLLLPAAQVGYIEAAWYSILWSCVRLTVGAAAFGWAMGWFTKVVLQKAHGDELVQTCITISFAYIAFFSADVWLGTSGVLTLCFMGVYLATYMPTLFPGREGSQLNTVWHFLVHFANTALFALVGVVIARDVFPFLEFTHFLKIVFLYVIATAARFAMIMILKPTFGFINKNYKVGVREAIMLVHGGLRGGVSTMLALMIYYAHGIDEADRNEVLILTSGIVLLTLAVNATTAQTVVSLLGHRAKDQNRLLQMEIGVKRLQKLARTSLRETRLHPFFIGTNWEKVEAAVTHIENPYDGVPAICETEDRMFNVLLMRAFKTRVWAMRDAGDITEEAVRILTEATSKCIDTGTLITTKDLLPLMTYPTLLITLYKRYFHRAPQQTTAAAAGQPHTSGMLPTHSLASPKAGSPTSPGFGQQQSSQQQQQSYLNDEDIAASANLSFIARYVLRWRLQVDMNFFSILIAYSAGLESLEALYMHYVLRPEHATLCEKWLESESESIRAKIRAYGKKRPRTLCAFMTKSASDLIVKDLTAGAEGLHSTLGFALPAAEALVHSCKAIRLDIKKWPTQIDLVNNQQLLMRSDLLKDFPVDLLRTLKAKVGEYTFKNGEEVSIGDCAGVVVTGVVESFGALERNRGPGDCFNVAPAVCNTVGVEYIVSSKVATVLAVPYAMIKAGINNKDSVYFRNSLLNLAVGEVLAPAAKETLFHCRNSSVDQIGEQMAAGHGRLIVAPWNNFIFTPRGPKDALVCRLPSATLTNSEGNTVAANGANATTTSAPSNPGVELLRAIASARREHLFFIAGSSFGTSDGEASVRTAVGPCLIPNTVLGRLRWEKGTELFAFSIPDSDNCVPLRTPISSPRAHHTMSSSMQQQIPMAARLNSQADLADALGENLPAGNDGSHSSSGDEGGDGSTRRPLEIGDLNAHYGDAAGEDYTALYEEEMEMSPTRFFDSELRTLKSNKLFLPARNPNARAGEDYSSPRAGASSDTASNAAGANGTSANNRSIPNNNNNDDEDDGGNIENDYASYVDLGEILRSAADRLATQYDPTTSLTCIPYFNRLQLMFIAELEQLMNATWALHLEETGADPHADDDNNSNGANTSNGAAAAGTASVIISRGAAAAMSRRRPTGGAIGGIGGKITCAAAISEARTHVAIITEKVLAFLQRFCTEGFSAEKLLYNRMLKEAQRRESTAASNTPMTEDIIGTAATSATGPRRNFSQLSNGNISNDSLGGGANGGAMTPRKSSSQLSSGGEGGAGDSGNFGGAGAGSPRFRPISPQRNGSSTLSQQQQQQSGQFPPLPAARSYSGGAGLASGAMSPRKGNSYLLRRGVASGAASPSHAAGGTPAGGFLGNNTHANNNINNNNNNANSINVNANAVVDLSALPPQVVLSEEIAVLMARQREAHTHFVERVAAWRERMDHNEMCHDAVIDGMAAFAATHFKEDNLMCQIAASSQLFGYDAVAEMSYRGAIAVDPSAAEGSAAKATTTPHTAPAAAAIGTGSASSPRTGSPALPSTALPPLPLAAVTASFERPPLAIYTSGGNNTNSANSANNQASATATSAAAATAAGRSSVPPPLFLGPSSAAAIAATVPGSSPLASVISGPSFAEDEEEEEIILETNVNEDLDLGRST